MLKFNLSHLTSKNSPLPLQKILNNLSATPFFCKELANEAAYCLLSTPGADNCLKVSGWFFIPSSTLAYLLLFMSFGLALFIARRFYLLQWFLLLLLLALGIYCTRVFLGAATFSVYGIIYEAQKLGLY